MSNLRARQHSGVVHGMLAIVTRRSLPRNVWPRKTTLLYPYGTDYFAPYVREARELPLVHTLFLPGFSGACLKHQTPKFWHCDVTSVAPKPLPKSTASLKTGGRVSLCRVGRAYGLSGRPCVSVRCLCVSVRRLCASISVAEAQEGCMCVRQSGWTPEGALCVPARAAGPQRGLCVCQPEWLKPIGLCVPARAAGAHQGTRVGGAHWGLCMYQPKWLEPMGRCVSARVAGAHWGYIMCASQSAGAHWG